MSKELLNKKKIKEFQLEIETLERQVERLFQSLNLDDEKLQALQDEKNYHPKDWQQIQNIKKKLEEERQKELDSVDSPKRIAEGFENLRNSANWTRI